jgi:phage gpG-like protein
VSYGGTRVELIENAVARPEAVLKKMGAWLVARSQRAFREQARGESKWKPRMNPNIPGIVRDLERGPAIMRRRFQDRPAVVDTGILRNSVAYRFLDARTIEYGSALPYASIQNYGGTSRVPVTQRVRDNLAELLRRNRRSVRAGHGGFLGKIASFFHPKKVKASRGGKSRDELSEMLGFLFGVDEVNVKVRSRLFIDFDREDDDHLRQLVKDAVSGA